ncbi:MAG: response regulator transcription factor [Pirellulales bacterium]|nr:response regulator transcription factor [Pirellulales bacterium]
MNSQPTVFVVDDDPAINQTIKELVELIGLKALVYTSARAFLDEFERTGPGCLVLDVRMPGMSGLELQRKLTDADDRLPVIIVTGHADVPMAVDAMKLGALDFLEKPFRTQELCESIQRAVHLDVERWRRRQQQAQAERKLECLTSAEREVMEKVLDGKTNKTIALELALSIRAVEDRRSRMMKKLAVKSRAELLELVRSCETLVEYAATPTA